MKHRHLLVIASVLGLACSHAAPCGHLPVTLEPPTVEQVMADVDVLSSPAGTWEGDAARHLAAVLESVLRDHPCDAWTAIDETLVRDLAEARGCYVGYEPDP